MERESAANERSASEWCSSEEHQGTGSQSNKEETKQRRIKKVVTSGLSWTAKYLP